MHAAVTRLRMPLLLGSLLYACAIWAAASDPVAVIKHTLQARYPKIMIEDVQPTPVQGIYAVFTGEAIVYTDQSADHLFVGRLIDTQSQRDLSAERLDAYKGVDFKKLPFDRAIKIVKGSGRRQLAVFEDPDCPYCQKLEQDLRAVTDVTEYIFLFPLDNLHPDAMTHARAIWCAPNRAAAWSEWMLERKAPVGAPCAGDPLAEIQKLAKTMRISSTPTLYFESGRRIRGASLGVEQLQKVLDEQPSARHTAATALDHTSAIAAPPLPQSP